VFGVFGRWFEVAGGVPLQPAEEEGKSLFELGDGQWNIPELRELLEEILREGAPFEDYLVEHRFPNIGHKRMLLNASLLEEDENAEGRILLAIEDVTEKNLSERRNQ
jgi:two-component system, OmpR family, sensor histidine kinase VicK